MQIDAGLHFLVMTKKSRISKEEEAYCRIGYRRRSVDTTNCGTAVRADAREIEVPRVSKLGLGKDDSTVVRIRVPNQLKDGWEAYCERLGPTTAQEGMRAVMGFLVSQPGDVQDALGELVDRLLGQQQAASQAAAASDLAPEAPLGATDKIDAGPKKRVGLSLTPSEYNAVSAIAQERQCSVQFWLTSLMRAALTNGITVGGAELKALGDFSYQLSGIGRNLNQMARQINADPDAHIHRLKAEAIDRLNDQVREGRALVGSLIDACSHRWELRQ